MSLIEVYREEEPRRLLRELYDSNLDKKAERIRRLISAFAQHEPSPPYLSGAFQSKLEKALPPEPGRKFAVHFEKLEAFATDRSLSKDCDQPPSSLALAWARQVLEQLETEALEPSRVVCSSEGGIAICFVSAGNYSDIECLNAGEILGVTSNRRDRPTVWEIEPSASGYARAAARIRDFLSSTAHDARRETR